MKKINLIGLVFISTLGFCGNKNPSKPKKITKRKEARVYRPKLVRSPRMYNMNDFLYFSERK